MKTSSSVCKSIPFCGSAYSGDGKHSHISSSNTSIPIADVELPHITGATSPFAQPLINPLYISSSDNSPSEKYLSRSSSSVSATASMIACLQLSIFSSSSGGISQKTPLGFPLLYILAFLDITFTTP
ncbi:hypothetical protein D3C73_1247520 [compost metagenome]